MTKLLAGLILFTAVAVVGCAENIVFQDPRTGQIVDCTAQGMSSSRTEGGQISGGLACVNTYRRMGWVRVN